VDPDLSNAVELAGMASRPSFPHNDYVLVSDDIKMIKDTGIVQSQFTLMVADVVQR
jgi:hypothetical protein